MEIFIVLSIFFKIVLLLVCLFILYKIIQYVGYDKSILILSVLAHFIGGYLMFFS